MKGHNVAVMVNNDDYYIQSSLSWNKKMKMVIESNRVMLYLTLHIMLFSMLHVDRLI